MIKMKNKDLIMLGMIIGIGFFFVGVIISNVFPSDESSFVSYKISAFMKLMGIGTLTSSMVIGGIIIQKVDRNLKMLLLILGLALLVIYTVGSPLLNWNIAPNLSDSQETGDDDYLDQAYDERPTALGTPGFELTIAFIAIIISIIVRKKIIDR